MIVAVKSVAVGGSPGGRIGFFGHYNMCDAAALIRKFVEAVAPAKEAFAQVAEWWTEKDVQPLEDLAGADYVEDFSDEDFSDEEGGVGSAVGESAQAGAPQADSTQSGAAQASSAAAEVGGVPAEDTQRRESKAEEEGTPLKRHKTG